MNTKNETPQGGNLEGHAANNETVRNISQNQGDCNSQASNSLLHQILPATGLLCVATPKETGGFNHRWCQTIEEAAIVIQTFNNSGLTVYIAQASFHTPENRKAVNAARVKNFWFDIDCGEGKPYADQKEGCVALKNFCAVVGLPLPTVVNSGNGLYAHWCLTEEILPDQWKEVATILKKLSVAHEFKTDPSRTSDLASVLRPVGATNRKRGEAKPVYAITVQPPVEFSAFASLLHTAAKAVKIDTTVLAPPKPSDINSDFMAGLEGPPASAHKVAEHCAQAARMRDTKGNLSEPEWYAHIGWMRYAQEGEQLIQEWSEGHPDYHPEATADKIAQHKFPPTTCHHFGEINPTGCIGCKWNGKIKTPLVLGREVPAAGNSNVDISSLRVTDTGLANVAASMFEGRVVFCKEADSWYIWDGRRWISDTPGGMFPYIKHMLKELYSSAVEIHDPDRRAKMLKELTKVEGYYKQETLIKALAVIPEMIVPACQLDSDPMLLNCLNGTIDLRSGQLMPHNQKHYITRIVNVEYDSSAKCPLFLTFLDRIFAGNINLTGYIRRLIGYCLTGLSTEQILVFFFGIGANGKTTLIRVILMLLFDFAASASADLLMLSKSDKQSNDLARLRGARVVSVNEVNEGARLDEAKVKTLTGGDPVTARFLFQEFFEYIPQFTLILVGNHKPTIKGRDHGIWRRIHLVPFTETIPQEERDPNLLNKLKAELPGILAWAIQGCLEWQQSGLNPPNEVVAAVMEYREAEDVFGQWLRDCCVQQHDVWDKADTLFESFKRATGLTHLSPNKFTKLMKEEGFKEGRKNIGKIWAGVTLKKLTTGSDAM